MHDDLPHRFPITWGVVHGLVHHAHAISRHIPYPLPCQQMGLFVLGQMVPLFMPLADRIWPVGLCQAIDVNRAQIQGFHLPKQCWGGGCGSYDDGDLLVKTMGLGMVYQENLHRRGSIIVRDSFALKEVPDQTGLEFAQADMARSYSRHRPGEAPAIAMEHRQRPQVDTLAGHACLDDFSQCIEITSTVGIDDPFRMASGARGVVDCNRFFLVLEPTGRLFR